MACIWKHPKSVNWFARYRGAEGKTINRSTGTRSRSDAELIARSWEIEAARERNNQRPLQAESAMPLHVLNALHAKDAWTLEQPVISLVIF
jgi:hypothetical protein